MITTDDQGRRTIAVASVETNTIAGIFRRLGVGEEVADNELMRATQLRDPLVAYRRAISAAKIVERENGIAMFKVVGVGWKRGGNTDILDQSEAIRTSTRRRSKRQLRRFQAAIDAKSLNAEQRTRFEMEATIHAIVAHTTGSGAVKRIETAVAQQQKQLPVMDAIDAMRD